MIARIIARLSLFLLLALGPGTAGADVKQAIYKVFGQDCAVGSDRESTGFLSRTERGMVTALHGVVGCNSITALNDDGENFRDLEIDAFDMSNDIAVLRSGALGMFIDANPGQTLSFSTDPTDRIRVIGYPLRLPRQIETQNIRIAEVKPLVSVIDPKDLEEFATCQSPSLAQNVYRLEGTIRPGESGAPILNALNEVVGVGMGGLDAGRTEIVWASRWADVRLIEVDDAQDADDQLRDRAGRNCPTNRFSSVADTCPPGTNVVRIRANPTSGPRPLLVNFSLETESEFERFLWDFGDGNGSVRRNVLNTYNTIGTFPVSITAEGPCGEATDTLLISTIQVPRGTFRVALSAFGRSLRMDASGDIPDLRKIRQAFDQWDTGNNDFHYDLLPLTMRSATTALMSGESNLFLATRRDAELFMSRLPDDFKRWDEVLNLDIYGRADFLRSPAGPVMGVPYGNYYFMLPRWAIGEDLEGIGSFIAWLAVR